MEEISTEVLVIGAGAAGARAALEANKAGAKTLLITKGTFGKAGTSTFVVAESAGFGASGFYDPEDSPEKHYQDIKKAGLGMCNRELARIIAIEAPRHLMFLDSIGVPIQRENGNFLAICSCFSTYPRSIRIKGHGKPIVESLKKLIYKQNIKILENTIAITPFLEDNSRIVGALVSSDGEKFIYVKAKAIILATGGVGQLFEKNLNTSDITGDGYVFGLKAGARLINMEFMQSGFGIIAPKKNVILQSWLWGLKPKIFSLKGDKFMEDCIPKENSLEKIMDMKSRHYPFSTRDCSKYMEIGVQSFINDCQDNVENNSVWMSLSGLDKYVESLPKGHNLKKMYGISKDFLESAGVKIHEKFQIACFAHAMNGGLVIDQFGRTDIEGLYAVGEVAGGPHGADRLGGNMFPTTQIFGERAGLHAAMYTKYTKDHNVKHTKIMKKAERVVKSLISGSNKELSIHDLRYKLQDLASRSLLIVREKKQLEFFIEKIEEMEESLADIISNDITSKVELMNLQLIGKSIAMAALLREESRGSHYRKDYPELVLDWNKKNIVIFLNSKEEIECKIVLNNTHLQNKNNIILRKEVN